MRRKNYKGKCLKRSMSKCGEVVKTYDDVQTAYADALQKDKEVKSFQCNVVLADDDKLREYMTDFLVCRNNGSVQVRECLFQNRLTKPQVMNLLDESMKYWREHGVQDWGIVTNASDSE